MPAARPDPLQAVNFQCAVCSHAFEAAPERVEDAPELEHHPFRYFGTCPACRAEAGQAAWERNLLKAWSSATGPRTPGGKARSAANLAGHPTPEEARRTRFNAMKHGLFARVATYFPARPGAYPHCQGCEYREDVCPGQTACLKRTELFLRHQVAFETKDPALLTELRGDTQAAVQALINDMVLAIAQDGGPRIREMCWYYDKDGGFHLAKWTDAKGEEHQIHELKAHPLLKPLIDFLSRNSMTLADMGMTPRVQDEQDLIEGHLAGQSEQQEQLAEYERRQAEALESLRGMIARSRDRAERDPILLEHRQTEGED